MRRHVFAAIAPVGTGKLPAELIYSSMEKIWIGTSGWSYTGWAGTFYPPKMSSSQWLGFYARQFPTVEINASFYRLPSGKMAQHWRDATPEGFLFAVKGSRLVTHLKKLTNTETALAVFFERMLPLGDRCGPFLWQLPPFLHKDAARLDRFLSQLPKGRHAVEFRHASWMASEVFDTLRRHHAACVWLSSWEMPRNFTITADFIYARFHGLEGGAAHNYSEAELAPWADHLRAAAREGVPSFAYFNNDVNARAPHNAKMLAQMVAGNLKSKMKN